MAENFNIEQRNYFSDGGKININMLDHISNDTADSINSVNRLLFTPGVLFLPNNISKNFAIEPSWTSGANVTITIGYINSGNTNTPFGGVAVDNLGRYIIINKNEAYVANTKWNSTNGWGTARPTDPDLSYTDNQGPTGNYYRNSGNYNIPVLINDQLTGKTENINYVYIKYQQIVSVDGNTTQITSTDNITSFGAETHYVSGYQIKLVNPNYSTYDPSTDADDVLKADGWIKIGEVYPESEGSGNYTATSSTGNASIPTPGYTQYGYLNGSFVGSPFSGLVGGGPNMIYPQSGDYIDLSTHVNAIGTGTVSSTNPHGLTAADIGVNISAINIYAATTFNATQAVSYSLVNPLENLADTDVTAQNYNTIFVNSNGNTTGNITIRLPEANADHMSYRYVFKRIDTEASATVSISTYNATADITKTNKIENGTIPPDSSFCYLPLGILGASNSTVEVCVGSSVVDNTTVYNWYII